MPSDDLIAGKIGIGTTVRIAWRNLARSRRRTLLTASTVGFAVFLLEVLTALLIGIERQSFDNLINYQTAHAKVYAAGYFENRDELPLNFTLTSVDETEALIRSVDGVAATTSRLTFSAQLSDGVDQITSIGTGIQIRGSDSEVFRIKDAVVDGSYLEEGVEGMLLGVSLAEFFDVKSGDYLTVLLKTRDGAYEALDLEIIGLLGTGFPAIDRNGFLLPLEIAQDMLDTRGEATEIAIRFQPSAAETSVVRRLSAVLGDQSNLEIKTWKEVEEDFMALVEMKRTAQGVFLSIFVIMAIVGITNTIVMATYERTREIGTMMAMGFRPSGIRGLFLVEGALTGFVGGAIGTIVAMLVVGYFASTGIDLNALYGEIDIGYPIKDMMYPAMSMTLFLVSWVLTGILSAIASLYPAARASRLRPATALRYV